MDGIINIFYVRFFYLSRVALEKKSFISGRNFFHPRGRHIFFKMSPALCNLFINEFPPS